MRARPDEPTSEHWLQNDGLPIISTVKLADLDLRELLAFEPQGGVIRFAGQRAVILDAVALGLLRKELIETVGVTAARSILSRFGYAHGWRTAESLRRELAWDDP